MYFVYRNGRYIDAAGASFRDFLAGRLDQLPGERPTFDDWADHLTTLFPDVRLKRFLEMRGADAGPFAELMALPAFWVGLTYDPASLAEASALIAGWTVAERRHLRDQVPRLGLNTPFRGGTALDVARDAVAIAERGLKRRAVVDGAGNDERKHLVSLTESAAEGRSPADRLLAEYAGDWHRDIDRVFDAHAF
jgi:glutamate--cysteine ligase